MMMFQKWCTLMMYIEHKHTLMAFNNATGSGAFSFSRPNCVWTDEDLKM
jgi:hypothetical protein